MLYFRRIWTKLLGLLVVFGLVGKFILKPISQLINFINIKYLSMKPDIYNLLAAFSDKTAKLGNELIVLAITFTILIFGILIIWSAVNIFTGQLKRDYYSAQLGKHLQRKVDSNAIQMNAKEEKKANFWLKRLRIICWRKHLYVLIPCGSNAAVQNVMKERCDDYIIGWLNQTFKDTNWANKINVCNKTHLNWLIIKAK